MNLYFERVRIDQWLWYEPNRLNLDTNRLGTKLPWVCNDWIPFHYKSKTIRITPDRVAFGLILSNFPVLPRLPQDKTKMIQFNSIIFTVNFLYEFLRLRAKLFCNFTINPLRPFDECDVFVLFFFYA